MNKSDYYNEIFRSGAGEEYDRSPGKEVLVNAFKDVSLVLQHAVVIDIGCGTGYMLKLVYSVVAHDKTRFIGIDISEEAIKIAKQKYPNMEFYVKDGTCTNFEDSSVDIVVSYGAYEHFDKPEDGIKEMARILKPGGLFLLMIPALGHYRKDRNYEGWYEDKTGQPQWNYFRETWKCFFLKYRLELFPMDGVLKYGAKNSGCFFSGRRTQL